MAAERVVWSEANTLLQLAYDHCPHRPGRGFCRSCLMKELQELLLEENPELTRGDARDLSSTLPEPAAARNVGNQSI